MRKPFTTSLNTLGDVLSFVTMAGLTVASAAVFAMPRGEPEPVVYLPTVVVTAKASQDAEPVRLPLVEVTAKRASAS